MFKYCIGLYLLLNIVIAISAQSGFMRPKAAKPDVISGHCPGRPQNAFIQLKNVRIIRNHGLSYISGKVTVKENNFTQYRMKFVSKRCRSQEALDSCEDVRDLVLDNVCSSSFVYGKVFSSFAKSIEPSMNCPVKEGTYTISNATFDVGSLFMVPEVDKWYWRTKASLFQQNTNIFIGCVVMEGQLISL